MFRQFMTCTASLALTVALVPSPAAAQSAALSSTSSGSSASGSVQPGSADTGSTAREGLAALARTLIAGSSATSAARSGSSLTTLLSSMSLLGSSEFSLPAGQVYRSPNWPKPVDESITTSEIVSKVVEDGDRLERWTVASPSMARNVEVQIMRAPDPATPAPMLYLLDGVDAQRNSDWLRLGGAGEFFAAENVTLVMPVEARASMYSDWVADDPAVGRHMWETFLVDELMPLLDADPDLNFNGHRGIGGISMGAAGAVHLANTNPELFDGVFGISGCYSTLDPVGRQTAQLTLATRGADAENMWGPFGSEEWIRHDTTGNPAGLGSMSVYLSSSDGQYLFDPDRNYGGLPVETMFISTLLEQGSYACTVALDEAMRAAGMNHHVVEYTGAGVHDWNTFRPQLAPAWETIRDSLY